MVVALTITKTQAGGSFNMLFDDLWLTGPPRSDLNGHGKTDLVCRNQSSGDNAV